MRYRFFLEPFAFAFALLACTTAQAASDPELAALRAEIQALRAQYEARLAALEARLQAAEAQPPGPASPSPASGGANFNPEISLTLSGTATHTSEPPNTYRLAGFMPSGGDIGPPRRGFSLGESELGLAANIDPYFRGYLNLALTPENEVAVEEAAIQAQALPAGIKLKAGRFLSGVGYLNEQHAHAWDFVDPPLAYSAFLGGQFADDGLQLKWLAPSDVFLEVGAEIGRGRRFPGDGGGRNGVGAKSVFVHAGDDWNESHSWRAGLSLLFASPRARSYDDVDRAGVATRNTFSGESQTLIADAVWKWAPQGNAGTHSFKLQAEYFRRQERGTLMCADADAANISHCGGGVVGDYRATQSGGYAQAVYQFMPRWRIGLRFNRIDAGRATLAAVDSGALAATDFPALAPYAPTRRSAMIDFSPSEFSRLRLQWANDQARDGVRDRQVFLQYLMSLGAHGAHVF